MKIEDMWWTFLWIVSFMVIGFVILVALGFIFEPDWRPNPEKERTVGTILAPYKSI